MSPIRNELVIKCLVFLICLVGGIGVAQAWSARSHFSESLDRLVVDSGAKLLGAVSSERSPYQGGKLQAKKDLQQGILKIKNLGLLTTTHISYSKLLREHYGIEFVDYGCIGTADLAESIRGYNDVSKEEIEKRYGPGVLEKAFAQAAGNYPNANK
jgi:hypothetical protein